jgi:hypothetical protein
MDGSVTREEVDTVQGYDVASFLRYISWEHEADLVQVSF